MKEFPVSKEDIQRLTKAINDVNQLKIMFSDITRAYLEMIENIQKQLVEAEQNYMNAKQPLLDNIKQKEEELNKIFDDVYNKSVPNNIPKDKITFSEEKWAFVMKT